MLLAIPLLIALGLALTLPPLCARQPDAGFPQPPGPVDGLLLGGLVSAIVFGLVLLVCEGLTETQLLRSVMWTLLSPLPGLAAIAALLWIYWPYPRWSGPLALLPALLCVGLIVASAMPSVRATTFWHVVSDLGRETARYRENTIPADAPPGRGIEGELARFDKAWPNSPLAEDRDYLAEKLAWHRVFVTSQDENLRLTEYLLAYPDGLHRDDAIERATLSVSKRLRKQMPPDTFAAIEAELRASVWKKARYTGTDVALRGFLNVFPTGPEAEDAQRRLARLHLDRLRNAELLDVLAFLDAYPDGPFLDEAENLAIEAALSGSLNDLYLASGRLLHHPRWAELHKAAFDRVSNGSIRDIEGFLDRYADSPHAEAALQRIAQLRQDPAPWHAARQLGTRAAVQGFLQDYPGHVDTETAQQFLAGVPARDLVAAGLIALSAKGCKIDCLDVRMINTSDTGQSLRLEAGTVFHPEDPAYQPMAILNNAVWVLAPGEMATARFDAACADITKKIPNEKNSMAYKPDAQLSTLTAVGGALDAEASWNVRQAMVWIVANNASRGALRGRLQNFRYGQPVGSTLSNEDIFAAITALTEAGVPIGDIRAARN